MNEHDHIRLQHMLESAQAAVSFTANENRESLDNDLKLVFAVVRAIEIYRGNGRANFKIMSN